MYEDIKTAHDRLSHRDREADRMAALFGAFFLGFLGGSVIVALIIAHDFIQANI